MKHILTFALLIMAAFTAAAQTPQGFSYQAVVRDANNAVVADETVEITVSILQGGAEGTSVYSETYETTTNANGLFTLTIGAKYPESFATINWSAGPYWIKTESQYGTQAQQLMSVPYALYAAQAGTAEVDLSTYAKKSDLENELAALNASIKKQGATLAMMFGGCVDLGLTSGTLWATCNIGATSPEQYGDLIAWGETEPYYTQKSTLTWKNGKTAGYDWPSYTKLSGGSENSLTKYNTDEEKGKVDNLTTLEAVDDAATANKGASWSMPARADWKELYNECYWEWTETYNGKKVYGFIVYKSVDKNKDMQRLNGSGHKYSTTSDAHIFFPAAGYIYEKNYTEYGSKGHYWAADLDNGNPIWAYCCLMENKAVYYSNSDKRFRGLSVRPILRMY